MKFLTNHTIFLKIIVFYSWILILASYTKIEFYVLVAIDLIVQHIRDFLSNRGRDVLESEVSTVHNDVLQKRPH